MYLGHAAGMTDLNRDEGTYGRTLRGRDWLLACSASKKLLFHFLWFYKSIWFDLYRKWCIVICILWFQSKIWKWNILSVDYFSVHGHLACDRNLLSSYNNYIFFYILQFWHLSALFARNCAELPCIILRFDWIFMQTFLFYHL